MPANDSAEIVVVGGGAAGVAAAIAAARRGMRVALLEQRPRLGGTVAHALIHTIGGLYDYEADHVNRGLPVELEDRLKRADSHTARRKIGRVWVLNAAPDIYGKVVEAWVAAEPNIRVIRNVRALQARADDARLEAISFDGDAGPVELQPRALIDCSGEAHAVRAISPTLIDADEQAALGGLIFCVSQVRGAELAFPQNIAIQRAFRVAVEGGELTEDFRHAWLDSGVRPDEIYIKLSIAGEKGRLLIGMDRLSQLGEQLMRVLRRFPAFSDAVLSQAGEPTARSGSRIRGEYKLSVDDVRSLARFDDTACRSAWPIEYWDPAKGVTLEYLNEEGVYEIPLRCLKVDGLENVWAAGKILSADHLAQASARIAGSCWAMGEAAGTAAMERLR